MKKEGLTVNDIDRIIEMAWEDRTPFSDIKLQFGLQEKEVIKINIGSMGIFVFV